MEKSTFFNSEFDKEGNADKTYNAEDFAEYFSSFIGNGIFPLDNNTGLMVLANNDNTVTVRKGKAFINGYYYNNTDNLIFKIENADGVLNRIDRIVLRLDFLKREIKAIVKKGDWNSNAKAKELQRDSDAYELALADIKISAGAVRITQKDVTDLRFDKQLCGIVHAIIDQINSTIIFKQFSDWYKQQQDKYTKDINNWTKDKQEVFNNWFDKKTGEFINKVTKFYSDKDIEFNNWFAKIKNQLKGDLATKIKIDLEELQKKVENNKQKIDLDKKEIENNKTNLKILNNICSSNGFSNNVLNIFRNSNGDNLYINNKKANKYFNLYDNGKISYDNKELVFKEDISKNLNDEKIETTNFSITRNDKLKSVNIYSKKSGKYLTLYDNDIISYAGSPLLAIKKPNFRCTVTMQASTEKVIKHNLGYCPIVQISLKQLGNIIVTWQHIDENTIRIYQYNNGNNNTDVVVHCW